MIGRRVRDPEGLDGAPGESLGLGLLDIETDMQGKKSVRPVKGVCTVTDTPIEGYEIHIGKTHGPDTVRPFARIGDVAGGAISIDGRIAGCYLHGIFSSDEFRKNWLDSIRKGSASGLRYEFKVEQYLDGVADGLEDALEIDSLIADAEM